VDWIHPARNRDNWVAFMDKVMTSGFHEGKNFVTDHLYSYVLIFLGRCGNFVLVLGLKARVVVTGLISPQFTFIRKGEIAQLNTVRLK
jgi:hypothetical protein